MSLLLILVCLLATGCATTTPANYKVIRFTATGSASHIHGLIEANTPQTAGMAKKGINFECPGTLELKSGPSEYKMYLDEFPKDLDLKVSVNGKELQRGVDCTWSGAEGSQSELIFSVK